MKYKITKDAFIIFIIYIVIGYLYIYYSDEMVHAMFPENGHTIQTIKGWAFITLSGILIFFLINRQIKKKNRINDDLQKKSDEYYTLYEEYLSLNEELSDANHYLHRSEEKFRSFVENANDIIYTVNPDGSFSYVSPNWTNMLGHDTKEVTGKRVMDFVHPDDVETCMDFLYKVLNTGEKQSGVEYRVKHKNGTWRWHLSNGAPLNNNHDDSAYLGIARDISDQKMTEQEIVEIRDRLLRAEEVAHFGNWEFRFEERKVIASEGAKKIYGLLKDDITIAEAQSVPILEDRPCMDEAMLNLIKYDKPYDIRFRIKRVNDGQLRHIHSIAQYDKATNIAFGVIHDITDQVEAEQRFKKYINNSPTAVFIVNQTGNFTFVNPSACELLGYAESELIKMSINDVSMNLPDEAPPEKFTLLQKSGFLKSSNVQLKQKNNNIIDVTLDSVKLGEDEYVAFCRDITQLKNTQRELNEKNNKLKDNLEKTTQINEELKTAKKIAEENDRLKTAFLNNMSHEIRTPMNGILGFSELLAYENIPKDKKQKFAAVIKSSGEQLLNIIDDILDVSRLEAGQLVLVEDSFYLNNVFDVIGTIAENQIQSRRKNLNIQIKKGLTDGEDELLGDKARLMQILTNLTVNAVKFTEAGYVEIGYEVIGNKLKINVEDTGPGIPKNMQGLIFERFRQTEDTIKQVHGGTGLGLAIVKGLVELMHGEIILNSTPGEGSSFTVVLPYKKPGNSSTHQPVSTDVATDFPNKTILIAEDDAYSFDLLKEYLDQLGMTIIHASNGSDSVQQALNTENLDLALIDIRMPEMDGYDAIREIKKTRPHLPIIAQTAYAMDEDKSKAYEAGCDDYISKPIDKDDLLFLLQKYL
jgi:PAS domain S-box-containing protein